MSFPRHLFLRLRGFFRKEQLDRELDAELAAHLEFHVEENLRSGMSHEEARRAALLKLGGLEQTKESVRDHRGFQLLESLTRDLRFGFRSLLKNRGLSFIAILALTMGIGATTV